jgi:hypothetical protein
MSTELETADNGFDAWAAAAESDSGLEGDIIRHNGKTDTYTPDSALLETGDQGIRLAMLMPTALAGSVMWDDHQIAARKVGLMDAGTPLPKSVEQGWNPSITCQCVEEGGCEIMTFVSTNWGGIKAFKTLASLYHKNGKTAFPVVTLHSKSRGDQYDNHDPIFRIVAWVPVRISWHCCRRRASDQSRLPRLHQSARNLCRCPGAASQGVASCHFWLFGILCG